VKLSGGDLVLVRESTEYLFPADPVLSEVDLLAEGTVRPGCVVVAQVFGEHLAQVVLIDDQRRSKSSRRRVPITRSRQVAALLRGPRAVWMGCDAEDMDAPGRDLHGEQDVQSSEEDRVDVEKSQASRPSA
jgi:hypothetical protein